MDHFALNGMSFFADELCCAAFGLYIAVTERVKRPNIHIRLGNEHIQEAEPMAYVLYEWFFTRT